MKSVKNVVLLGALSVCFSAPAFAKSQAVVEPTAQAAVVDVDVSNRVFEQKASIGQVAKLSHKEMKETEGALIWFAPVAWAGVRYAITGFTRHGLNQVISRGGVGVSNQAILNTLRSPLSGSQSFISGANANTTRYIGQNATVNLNRSGQVTSAWSRNSSGWR